MFSLGSIHILRSFFFSTGLIVFIIRNTYCLGSFSTRRLIFSMIILCLSSESMWVSNDGISQTFAVYDSIDFLYLCLWKESNMFGNLSRIFCWLVNSSLINMEIAVSKWLVVNWIYNRSFVVTQVRLRLIHRPHGRGHFSNSLFLLYSVSTLSLSFFMIFFPL